MNALVPLPIALPLVTAATLAAFGHLVKDVLHGRIADVVALAAAVATTVISATLLLHVGTSPIVYWLGHWRPRQGIALGIDFYVDPFAAGLALLAGVLTIAGLVFSWRYFTESAPLYQALILVFLGGMDGFALTGDLFDLFVFFELIGVCAFALTAYRVHASAPLQGAINFAVTNSVAGFMILTGIGLLYGRTDALNMAQIGHELAGRRPDGLVIASFVLIMSGFLTKAAAVPFHFWLADAYAVAPAPVCVLFSGLLSDLGLYALARVYWTVFSGTIGSHPGNVQAIFLAVGTLTALVGATMCFLQRQLKRMLAFATISHIGLFLLGIALLSDKGLAGTALYLLADGLVKGSLFLAAGAVIHTLESGDELDLHGRGRRLPVLAAVFVLGGLALAALPPFGTFLGKSLIEDSASRLGYGWVPVILLLAEIGTGGAVLRAAGRIFGGLGARQDPLLTRHGGDQGDEESEEEGGGARPSLVLMVAPAAALVLAGLLVAFVPHIAVRAEHAARGFQDRPAYAAAVLHANLPHSHAHGSVRRTQSSVLFGLGSTLGALLLAAVALYWRRVPQVVWRVGGRIFGPGIAGLRTLHSGHVGDYVTWLTVGAATLGAVFTLTLR